MTDTPRTVKLVGRIFLTFTIEAKTGLHIGGSPGTLAIGNVDNPVIRNPLNNQPYVPGSSLRGKMRSQFEKDTGSPQNNSIGQVTIHTCKEAEPYQTCPVCRTFGIPGEYPHSETSRLIVRDAFLTEASAADLERIRTDLPFTEVKWEAAIDRVTSAAVPRQQERVPAGAKFQGALTFSLYSRADLALFDNVLRALLLVEEDYLGGQGSRGSGQVVFVDPTIKGRSNQDGGVLQPQPEKSFKSMVALAEQWPELRATWFQDLD